MPELFNLSDAQELADLLISELSPYCEKISVAGSVRRLRPEVKDIEIVCVAKTFVREWDEQADIFSPIKHCTAIERVPEFAEKVKEMGIIEKGNPVNGRYVKLVHSSRIPVDLFIVQDFDYGRQLCIRTGNYIYSKDVIATQWSRKGWCGTENGLRRKRECRKISGKWVCEAITPTVPPPFETEESFYEFLGIKWLEPSKRK